MINDYQIDIPESMTPPRSTDPRVNSGNHVIILVFLGGTLLQKVVLAGGTLYCSHARTFLLLYPSFSLSLSLVLSASLLLSRSLYSFLPWNGN
jgi:hypothetical protein